MRASKNNECYSFATSGKCKFGNTCRFEHNNNVERGKGRLESNGNSPATNECYDFRNNGTCRFGDSCRFSHSISPQSPSISVPQPSYVKPDSQQCYDFAATGACRFGNTCRFQHTRASSTSEPQKIVERRGFNGCFSYINNGSCRFGDSCRFDHSVQMDVVEPAPEVISQRRTETSVCYSFAMTGKCGSGERCRFLHPTNLPPAVHTETNAREPKVCYSFAMTGKCGSGERCRFLHPMNLTIQAEMTAPQVANVVKEPSNDEKEFGWLPIHNAVFYAKYERLAKIIMKSNDPVSLLNARTTKPFEISWREYDDVDKEFDNYYITIRAGSSPLDVAATTHKDLDRGGRTSGAVDYLLDSYDGEARRKICIIMLKNPGQLSEILGRVRQSGEYSFAKEFYPLFK